MSIPKVTSKFTKEELNHKTVELKIREDGLSVAAVWTFDSWTHPDGDGIFVGAHGSPGSELPQHRSPHSIGWSTLLFPQRLVDLIERHPDQSVAAFRLVSLSE